MRKKLHHQELDPTMTSIVHAKVADAISLHNDQKYRPDIDGLRAIAVLAVIFYHFKVPFFTGGFIGVDVFFVISGYLITKGILSQQRIGRFNFSDFYTRRVRRLIPALLATIVASFIAAAFLFSPADFKQMSGSTVYALAGISNLFFWMETGYFDTASDVKPLLHTWSLSVEIQFYILWPLMLIGISNYTKNLLAATSTVFILGAAAAYFFLQHDASGAFFLSPFRVHEFLLGALVVLVEQNRFNQLIKEIAYATGLALLITPVFFYDSDTTLFPGAAAMVPVIGAALMIFAGDTAKLAKVCRSRGAVKVGEISYSLYLVHWPLYVFTSYIAFKNISAASIVTLLLATFALATALYYVIEKPLRHQSSSKLSGPEFALSTLICSLAIIVTAASSWAKNGWEWRLPEEIRNIAKINIKELNDYTWTAHKALNKKSSFDPSSNKEKILIIGDSQAADVVNMLTESGEIKNYDVISRIVVTDCATPYLSANDADHFFKSVNTFTIKRPELISQCRTQHQHLMDEKLLKSADKIFISFQWRPFAIDYNIKAINHIKSITNAKIYVFSRKDLTQGSIAIITSLGRTTGANSYAASLRSKENEEISKKMSFIPNTTFIDLMSLTCPNESSCVVLTPNNQPVFFDSAHLTKDGAKMMGLELTKTLL